MRKALILASCLAGCGGQGDEKPVRPAVQTATLTGLYESGEGPRRSQLCIVESGGDARFGLVTRPDGTPGCSGAGTAVRAGDRLRLAMAGEEACVISARFDGAGLALPADLPPGCSYYCAPGASLAGIAFEKTGGTAADALSARDLAGDALCG